jgi:hypothetical protein
MRRHGGWVEKPARGWRQYRDFCVYFGVKTLLDFLKVDGATPIDTFLKGVAALSKKKCSERWVNCGGQVMAAEDLEILRAEIKSGKLDSWEAVHARYNELWSRYPEQKARYALHALERALGSPVQSMDRRAWKPLLSAAKASFSYICESSYASRQKDYEDPFRRMVYESDEEMLAVLGKVEDNSFLVDLKRETKAYTDILTALAGAIISSKERRKQ